MKAQLLLCGLACCSVLGCSGDPTDPHLLHRQALVADMHCDTALRMKSGFDLGTVNSEGDIDLSRLENGGVDLQVFACWLPTETPADSCRAVTELLLDSLHAQLTRYGERIGVCLSASDAQQIIEKGRIAAFIGIENGVAIESKIENLQHYYDRGVRYMTLTHTSSNDWCISSADTAPTFNGLTDFGQDVVREMNRLGMIIDLSHAHPTAVETVLRISRDPVIASHSCVRALCDHDRNLSDAQIKAIAANGGVIGVNFYSGYLSDRWNRVSDSIWAIRRSEIDSVRQIHADDDSLRRTEVRRIYAEVSAIVDSLAPVDIGMVCDHIDHIVRLVGPDYVGLGSDFDGVPSYPDQLEDCTGLPEITVELIARGYSAGDIRKILGANFIRVFREVCDKPVQSQIRPADNSSACRHFESAVSLS